MKREELEAIRARVEAAISGPWRFILGDSYEHDYEVWTGDQDNPSRYEKNARYVARTPTEAEARHIAHSREDIPALLDEIEWLECRLLKWPGYEDAIRERRGE